MSSSSTPNALQHTHAVAVLLDDDVITFGFRLRDPGVSAMNKIDYTLTSSIKAARADVAADWAKLTAATT